MERNILIVIIAAIGLYFLLNNISIGSHNNKCRGCVRGCVRNKILEGYENIQRPYVTTTHPNTEEKSLLDRDSRISQISKPPFFDPKTYSIHSGPDFKKLHITPAWANVNEIPADNYNQNDDPRLLNNKCSLSCCSSQYPIPFETAVDKEACNRSKYLPSSYGCETGCLCISHKQAKMLQGIYD
jgi:hypothetical protein